MKRAHILCSALVLALIQIPTYAGIVRLYIDPVYGSTSHTGCKGEISLIFNKITLSDGTPEDRMTVEIKNTTPVTIGSRMTGVGFELPQSPAFNITLVQASEHFQNLGLDVAVSPGWLSVVGGYDVMLTKDGNFEGGGNPKTAPAAGESQTIVLSLGNTGKSPSELQSLFASYYTAQPSFYAVARFLAVGPNGEGSDKVGGATPEPASLALVALAGMSTLLRRRRGS